jgi:hypothetical protein
MTDQPKPETNGQKMNRLIREAPTRNTRHLWAEHIRRSHAARKNGEHK